MMVILAEAYFHTFDPFAIQFTPTFGLRWYGLSYATGFLIFWWYARWMAKTNRTSLSVEAAGDLLFYCILGVLLGGRLGFAVFYDPHLFIGFSKSLPFWDLLALHIGGMASHGGFIGVIVAVWLFSRRHAVPMLHTLDICALGCTAGLCLGRLANFINAELWGRALPAAMQAAPPWWSVKYPEEIKFSSFVEDAERTAQLSENLASIPGANFMSYDKLAAAAQGGDADIISALQPVLTAYYPSQLIQALTDGPILAALLIMVWLKPRMPGVVGGWFLIGYGFLRISSEAFREPDVGIALLLGWSRGQVLSVLMILIGAIILAMVLRRKAEPLGGLKTPKKDISAEPS